jgi:hypothetical protein
MATVLFQGIGWADRKIRSNFIRINHGYEKVFKNTENASNFYAPLEVTLSKLHTEVGQISGAITQNPVALDLYTRWDK